MPVALFAVVVATHCMGVITSYDSLWSIPTARSLLREGNTDLDEYAALLDANRFYAIESIGGRHYSLYPIGPSLVALPVVLASTWPAWRWPTGRSSGRPRPSSSA